MRVGRDAMGTGIYFGSYESSKYLLSNIAPPGPWTYAASGALCGIVAWCVVFPIDTAKSIVQRDILIHEAGVFYRKKNLWDFNWMSRRMYRGMSYVPQIPACSVCVSDDRVSIMRSAIVNAINFTLYEGVRKKITAWEQESSSTIGL
jgi:solute carrier family 25 carnitine/acylcarnitine transporter 20/29